MTPDLIARYDQRVPRYTSYPTAPHFTPEVGAETYGDWLASLASGTETSIYLHVPFCAELCLYCGCHTTVARRYAPIAAYVDLLAQEIDLVASRLQGSLKVRHIHWGGGTPTILKASDFARLSACVASRIGLASEAEIAIEIDPRTISPAQVETLATVGVNRASRRAVGSFDPPDRLRKGHLEEGWGRGVLGHWDGLDRAQDGRSWMQVDHDAIWDFVNSILATCTLTYVHSLLST